MQENHISERFKFALKHARRFALLILLGFVGLGALSALSLSQLRTEYSVKQFLPAQHPLLVTDDKIRARFQLAGYEPFFALVTLPPDQPDWLEKDNAEKLRVATERLRQIPDVERAFSLGTIEGASASKEGLTVGRLLELTPEKDWRHRVLQDPILSPQLISPDARTALVAVGLGEANAQRGGEILDESRRLLTESFAGATVRLGGIPAVQSEIGKTLGAELKNFLVLSLLASLVTLLFFFRSLSSVFIPLTLILLANLVSLAWMAWTGVTFTVLTSSLPVLISITVVSMTAHTMLRYASDWEHACRAQASPNPLRVLFRSYQSLLLPNFLTSVTTAIGFFAIGIAEIPLIRQYGLTVGFSIFLCWFVVIAALLPLLILFPIPRARNWTRSRARWATLIAAYPRQIVLGFTLACGACLFVGKDLNWSARLFDDLPQGHEARATTELVDKNLGGMIPLHLVVEREEENAWNDPVAIAKLDELAHRWRQDPAIGSVVGPQDFLRAAGRVQGRDLASSRQEAAEYAFLYAFADENPYKHFVSGDGKSARLALRLRDIPADQMKKLVQHLRAETEAAFPGWRVTATGMATSVHAINNELCQELIFGFWQALGLIALVLACVFRSVRWTIAAVVPNLAPVALLLFALSVAGTPIKPGIALIFSIALGISFDNTVYLLGRLRFLQNRSGRLDITKAWYQEGNLCLYSSIALSAGFLVFLASFFALNQQFGMYMLVAIAGGLAGDLIFMPALLLACPWFLQKKKVPQKKENPMEKAIAASLAFALLASSTAQAAPAKPLDAKSILERVQKNVNSRDEEAMVKMTIIEADGSKKERVLDIRRKGEAEKQKVLVRMQAPADLKGMALLSVNKDQWLYQPSSKQTRRIQSGKRSASFMDSELSFEDMGAATDAGFESKLLREETLDGKKMAVIESKPKGESSYGKILFWVSLDDFLVTKMEYFDKQLKPLKVSNFSDYKKFDRGTWRAGKIQVQNLQNKRGTVLELSELKLNKGIADEEFTESALTEGD